MLRVHPTTPTSYSPEAATPGSCSPLCRNSSNHLLSLLPTQLISATSSFTFSKTRSTKSTILHPPAPAPIPAPSTFQGPELSSLATVSNKEVTKIVRPMKTTTCSLDPLPTSLTKTCLTGLAPSLTAILNKSLTSGIVPHEFKLASATPILKKPSSNPDDLTNYRPISNLPFVSKLLEQPVSDQLQDYLARNSLLEHSQSGFRERHSTETALVWVTNDLLVSADTGRASILMLLDLSAAFDTVNHSILLDRLHNTLGISGSALGWFRSYLTNRHHCVRLGSSQSATALVPQGIPQGLVLRPLLFCIYMFPLGNIMRKHGLSFHFYADDSQLYIPTSRNTTTAINILSNCLLEIKAWMQQFPSS